MLSHATAEHARIDSSNVFIMGMPGVYNWFVASGATSEYWTFLTRLVRTDELCRINLKGRPC
jgi:hypothetical protein